MGAEDKKYYRVELMAEDFAYGYVLLTREEALLVKSVFDQTKWKDRVSSGPYCGTVEIDVEQEMYDTGLQDNYNIF